MPSLSRNLKFFIPTFLVTLVIDQITKIEIVDRFSFFLGTGALAIVLLLVFLRRLEPGEWLAATAIGGVLGGAIGNLTDRIVYGEVIDFLDFRLIGGYIWPTFNMADCWIVVGVGILMVQMFFEEDPDAEPNDADGAAESGSS
ncbi:MAG: signal peptidase II [bacterium]